MAMGEFGFIDGLTFAEKRELWYELGRELMKERTLLERLDDDFSEARNTLWDLYGEDPLIKTRRRPFPCLRYILADYLVNGCGHNISEVAHKFDCDRTTLWHGLNYLPYLLDDNMRKLKFNFNKIMYENKI